MTLAELLYHLFYLIVLVNTDHSTLILRNPDLKLEYKFSTLIILLSLNVLHVEWILFNLIVIDVDQVGLSWAQQLVVWRYLETRAFGEAQVFCVLNLAGWRHFRDLVWNLFIVVTFVIISEHRAPKAAFAALWCITRFIWFWLESEWVSHLGLIRSRI